MRQEKGLFTLRYSSKEPIILQRLQQYNVILLNNKVVKSCYDMYCNILEIRPISWVLLMRHKASLCAYSSEVTSAKV